MKYQKFFYILVVSEITMLGVATYKHHCIECM